MLDERQLKAIELLSLGELTAKEIAEQCSISERQLFRWKNEEEFKAKWQGRSQQYLNSLEQEGKARMSAKGQMAIDNIVRLANTSSSEKVKLDANIFIYESIFGKATSRIQDVTAEESKDQDKVDNSTLENEFEKFRLKKLK